MHRMSSLCSHSTRRVLICGRVFQQQHQSETPASCRLRHSQSLWEYIMGHKIEASAAKKLEDAFLEYNVRKAVPSWLPFFPNCSFWIPSNEHTIKHLQVLAQRIREFRESSKERSRSGKSTSRWSDDDKNGATSTAEALSIIYRLLSHVEPPAAETTGTIAEPMLDKTEGGNSDCEGEVEALAKKKVKGG